MPAGAKAQHPSYRLTARLEAVPSRSYLRDTTCNDASTDSVALRHAVKQQTCATQRKGT